ncbi:hypothetical protein O9993_15405 [Vibrio lentus]|nr:hypothetical protein [Vibrio lentus]
MDKVYTSTGFSTFTARVDLMSQQVITDNWVLGFVKPRNPNRQRTRDIQEASKKKYTDDYISYWRNV